MGTTVIHPTNSWTSLSGGINTVITGTYVEVDYVSPSMGALACPLEQLTGIPAGATIDNILLTMTTQNDSGVGFVPRGWFQPQSTRSQSPTSPNLGGFADSDNFAGDTPVVGTSPAPITYDFAGMAAGGWGGIPDFDAWVTGAEDGSDPLNIVLLLTETFHSPGFVRYYTDPSEFYITVEWTPTTPTVAVVPPLRLTNRDDGLAGSVPRLTGSASRQGSNRLTGYL